MKMQNLCIGIFLFLNVQKALGKYINVTVELAVFCDFEFGERLQHNETEIREFWAIRLYDVNLRFKTLPSTEINFVITSLTTIKNKDQQAFIENLRDSTGKVSLSSILNVFPDWVHTRYRNTLAKYDFALLALGAETNDNHKSWAFVDAACSYNHGFAIVRFEKDNWWSSCGSLEYGLSTVLGAWGDSHYKSECQNPKYIKGKECSKNHFFFSSCTNNAIYNSIQQASCLHRIDSEVPSIFGVKELNIQPPSIKEQCILLTNNSNVWVNISDERRCFSTICHSDIESNVSVDQILYPVDNSPCDDDKSCFRGRCIQNGFQIMNTVSLKCLHSSNLFTSDDNLRLINCPDVPTALDRFMVLKKEDHGVFLATPYTSINGTENSNKCMSYVSSLNRVQYQNCNNSRNKEMEFYWDLLDLTNGNEEFQIRHKESKFCLEATNDTVQMVNCSSVGKNMYWKFHENKKPPSQVFWKPKLSKYLYTSEATLDLTEKSEASKENRNPTNFCCHGNWWIYLGLGVSLVATVILSISMYRMHKQIKQIILRQLLNQDFHELSRIIASENIITNSHLN